MELNIVLSVIFFEKSVIAPILTVPGSVVPSAEQPCPSGVIADVVVPVIEKSVIMNESPLVGVASRSGAR